MNRSCILGQMSPHHQIRIHRPQRTRPKIVQTGRSNRGQVTYEFKRGELGTRTDPPRRRLDATPGVPEAPEHKREHFETMLFAIRLQFGQQRSLRNAPSGLLTFRDMLVTQEAETPA